jgi:hypothetical protein
LHDVPTLHYKYTWTCEGKTHNQIDHVLRDKRQHSSVIDAHSLKLIAILTSLVTVKVTERLLLSNWVVQKFDMERFNLRKLNHMEIKE